MKLKFLLFCMMLIGLLNAQEPNRALIISEARISEINDAYVELTNMGEVDIDLSEYKFGLMRPSSPEPIFDVWNDPWVPESNRFFMLPKNNT